MAIFETQGSVATRLGCGGYLYMTLLQISYYFLLSLTVKEFLKIGQYLVKLWARVRCLVFFDSRCRMTRTDKRIDIQTDAVP